MDLPGADTASPPIPFHHIITEQAKSFIALQELQNEVGALLEFRDVVMETFPQLRGKLASRGRWEPGIRVRKKPREETNVSQPRSRSNSRSKTAISGTSAIQDSGFCTESKKTTDQEAEDELWNLLDLIHTKGTKLRLEVESLQDKYQNARRSRSLSDIPGESHEELHCQIQGLRREKDMLLDRVTEMEAENLANLAQTNQLLAKLGALAAEKRDLEEQLRSAISTKTELNSRIHDLHSQFVIKQKVRTSSPKPSHIGFTPVKGDLTERLRDMSIAANRKLDFSFDESPRPGDPVSQRLGDDSPLAFETPSKLQLQVASADKRDDVMCLSEEKVRTKLGRLDGILTTPKTKMYCVRGVTPDKEKTAAILMETNLVELQRHLITTTYENQVAHHKLERLNRYRNSLSQQLHKFKEENEDLRFQLEEKSIELEGSRARIRLLERQGVNQHNNNSKTLDGGPEGVDQCSSSTESAHQEERSPLRKQQRSSSGSGSGSGSVGGSGGGGGGSVGGLAPSRIPLKAAPRGSLKSGRPPLANSKEPRPSAPRKSSESSFNSTSSSPSIRTPPLPSQITKKQTRPPSNPRERIVAESEPKLPHPYSVNLRHTRRAEAITCTCTHFDREYKGAIPKAISEPDSMDSLEREKSPGRTQELDRSYCSALAPKTWHHSLEYFDSIDSSAKLNGANSFIIDREALADYDSLDQMTSDMV